MEKDGEMCRIYPLLLLCRSHDRRRRRRTTHYRDYAREEAGKVSKAAGRREREREKEGARRSKEGLLGLLFVSSPPGWSMEIAH